MGNISLIRDLIRCQIQEVRARKLIRTKKGVLAEYGSKEHVETVEEDISFLAEMKLRYPKGSPISRDLQRVRESLKSQLRSARRIYSRSNVEVIQEEPIINPEDFTLTI